MSNGISTPVDFTTSLSSFLATNVSNGTWADVMDALKVDDVAAGATDITAVAGQLWANVVDDMFKATWDQFFMARKLWGFADATARDGAGSVDGVAVNDICNLDGTDELYYCTAVAAGSSTWVQFAGGGAPVKTLVQVDWVAGAGSQTYSASVNEFVLLVDLGGQASRPLEVTLPASANEGDRISFRAFAIPVTNGIVFDAGGVTIVDQPFSPGPLTTVTAQDAAGQNWVNFYAEYEYRTIGAGPGWLLTSYHQQYPVGGAGGWSSVLGVGNSTSGQDAVVSLADTLYMASSETRVLTGGSLLPSSFVAPIDASLGAQTAGGGTLDVVDVVTTVGTSIVGSAFVDVMVLGKYDIAVNSQPVVLYSFRGLIDIETADILIPIHEVDGPDRFVWESDGATLTLAIRDQVVCSDLRVTGQMQVVAFPGRSAV